MGILLALIAGLFMPLTNLTVRKSLDFHTNTKGYFIFQMISSFLFAVLFGPIRTQDSSICFSSSVLGSLAGVLIFFMLLTLGKALEKGPPGLTFAILNSATVIPGVLMATLFGSSMGYEFTFAHALGCGFVLVGLFWAAKGLQQMGDLKQWVFFSGAMFVFHILLLTLYQFRALLLNPFRPLELYSFFPKEEVQSESFIPFMFLTAALLQTFLFLKSEKRRPKKEEIFYGLAGGLSNFLVTFFLLLAATKASFVENALIYPLFSVVGIILTNAWGQRLYQEQVNWKACQICALGLIVGTVDWKGVAAAIGF